MLRQGMTIKDAATEWVRELNRIPTEMLWKVASADFDAFREVTCPCKYDRVYVYESENGEHGGEIVSVRMPSDDDDTDDILYEIELDDDSTIFTTSENFEVQRDDIFPMWGWMWSFGDSLDDYWLENKDGIRLMSECGFRIFEFDEFGYYFGIDGAGYDFYANHWIPLYKARGLCWHDVDAE